MLGDESGKEAIEAQSETDDVFLKKIEATMLTQVRSVFSSASTQELELRQRLSRVPAALHSCVPTCTRIHGQLSPNSEEANPSRGLILPFDHAAAKLMHAVGLGV